MLKNVIFDLGNVCVTFQPDLYFYPKYQHDTKRLCQKLFHSQIWSNYDQGLIQKEDIYRYFQNDEDQKALYDMITNWYQLLKVLPETMECFQQLKAKGYQIYILSNTSKEGADTCLSLHENFAFIDGAVYSYEIKVNKPDVEIYQALIDKYQLKVDECIFLDDKKENIDTALQLGMQGIVCEDIRTCINTLWQQLEDSK